MGARRENMLAKANCKLEIVSALQACVVADIESVTENGGGIAQKAPKYAKLAILGFKAGLYDRAGELLTPEFRQDEREQVHQTIQSNIGRVGLNG